MAVSTLIRQLSDAKEPERRFDEALALVAGYRRVMTGSETGNENVSHIVHWISPVTGKQERLPYFTQVVDHAISFAEAILPEHVGGCSWEPGMGSARINDGPICQSFNPAIALCIAALKTKYEVSSG